jgi:Zn-finger nucleic acid-binding protein
MKCPRCENSVLDERERDGVTVDVCRECRGVWLDRSELERIVARALREQQEAPGAPQAAPQAAPPQAAPPQAPPGYAPPPGYGPPPGYAPPPAPGGYYHRDDDTPPHGYRRDGYYHPHRRKHWFESLTDIFD